MGKTIATVSALMLAGSAMLSLGACAQPSGSGNAADAADGPTAPAPCPDDGDRLPVTGLCASRSLAYLNTAGGQSTDLPDGCEWAVQETPFDKQVLLYRALKCAGKTTKLAYKPGADLAELSYETAGYSDPDRAMKGSVLVQIAKADPKDPSGSILKIALPAVPDPAARQKCHIEKAGNEFWPTDALVVDDLTPEEAAKVDSDGPRNANCGHFGMEGDASVFWRVFQGHAWFFQLGQDSWQIDPGSFTLLSKDSRGQWSQVD